LLFQLIINKNTNSKKMADIAVENKDTPVVDKDVEETETPKVAEEEDETSERSTENGTTAPEEATENGVEDKVEDEEEEEEESTNGDSTDAPAEAVKRKLAGGDAAEGTPAEGAATPEKKAKLDESATKDVEPNGAETEVAA
jgi:hypothetical protein